MPGRLSSLLVVGLIGLGTLLACQEGEGRSPSTQGAGMRPADPAMTTAAGAPMDAPASAPAGTLQDTTPGASPAQEVAASRTSAIVRASQRVSPAVVTVQTLVRRQVRPRSMFESFFLPPNSSRESVSGGSGFVTDPDGIVLTNEHVVRGAEEILVTFPDGRDFEAELVGADALTDVAVLRILDRDEPLPTAPLGTSRGLMAGEWVIAIGNPTGRLVSNPEPTVTVGVVSAVDRHIFPSGQDRQMDRGFYLGMIQTDAAINPGNSGGPLVNALGEVVGMNSSIFSRSGGSEGLGFAIPIDRAVRIAQDLIRFGEVRRAWVGIDVAAVQEDDPFGRSDRVQITEVAPDSPAAEEGIRAGTPVLEAAGRRIVTALDFEAALLDLRSGEELELVLGEAPGRRVRLTAVALPSVAAERVTVLQGLELVTVTQAIRAERGIVNESGALITEISPALASSLRLQRGDVLLQINNSPIREAEDVERIFGQLPDGALFRIYFERAGRIGYRDRTYRR